MDRIPSALQEAVLAADYAHQVREDLRWRSIPGNSEREEAIDKALDRIDAAMKPIRTEIGRLPWYPQPQDVEDVLRAASARCQYERRQLKKMRR